MHNGKVAFPWAAETLRELRELKPGPLLSSLGGPWVLASRVIIVLSGVVSTISILRTLLITTHEPGFFGVPGSMDSMGSGRRGFQGPGG